MQRGGVWSLLLLLVVARASGAEVEENADSLDCSAGSACDESALLQVRGAAAEGEGRRLAVGHGSDAGRSTAVVPAQLANNEKCKAAGINSTKLQSGIPLAPGLFMPAYSSLPLSLLSSEWRMPRQYLDVVRWACKIGAQSLLPGTLPASCETLRHMAEIKRAVIYGHGALSNANDYFCDGVKIAQHNHKENDTLTLALWFGNESVTGASWSSDVEAGARSIFWGNKQWMSGSDSVAADGQVFSSFGAMDELIRIVNAAVDDGRLPNLERITFAGFSAGCQLGSRWAVLSKVAALSRVQTVVGDCGSYMYLDEKRPASSCRAHRNTGPDHRCDKFEVPGAAADTYNRFKYGLSFSAEQLRHFTGLAPVVTSPETLQEVLNEFPSKRVGFLFGTKDVCNCRDPDFVNEPLDCFPKGTSCEPNPNGFELNGTKCCDTWPDTAVHNALVWNAASSYQGTNRLQRGLNYMQYLALFFKERGKSYAPSFELFDGGHDSMGCFTSEPFTRWAFGGGL